MPGGVSTSANLAGFGLRRLARVLYEGFGNKGEVSQSRPYHDPAMQSGLNLHSFWMGPVLGQGVVTDSTALGHCYRVQLEKAHYPIVCFCAGLGSNGAAGVRDLTTIQPGTRVMVVHHPQTYYGVILCTIPPPGLEGKLQLHQQISHATRNRVDEAHKQPFKQGGRGAVPSFTAGRPFDSTTIGEAGHISETGLRQFIDPFMVQMAVDEACGVFAFYHDQLLRIAGYNLRMFTAGMEREALDDQEEYNDWTGYTPFPWEQMGQFERQDPRKQNNARTWQLDEPHYGPWEPNDDKLRPWHREVEYHGYLGQGGLHIVSTKPATPPPQAEFLQDDIQFPGLAADFTGLDGRRIIGSAKGISIVKRIAQPSPTRRYVPEQTSQGEGDSPDNYKHAGIVGDGPEHTIKGQITADGEFPELQRAAGVLDMHAYWFNFGMTHPFFYHEKDWQVFDEGDLQHTETTTVKIPDYSELATGVYLRAPQPIDIEIDHRYQNVSYWQNECGIEFLEDGGVEIYDGWGSEFRMTAGSSWITAPGDVWINPGRNVNIWGGDDINIRAKNSLDLVTTNGDIRSKAERNNHMLAGNSGEGGVLIESRGADVFDFDSKTGEDVVSGGVFLRATQGTVGGWGASVYWRTGGGDIPNGPIVLDAAEGESPVFVNASTMQNYVPQGCLFHFGGDGGAAGPSAAITQSGVVFPGNMCLEDGIVAGGGMALGGSVASLGGFAGIECPFVGCIDDPSEISSVIDDCTQAITSTFPGIGAQLYENILENLFYQDMKPGNADVIRTAEFSLRTIQQYGTSDFRMYEMRWQQMGRQAQTLTGEWKENPVETRTEPETYPYPGKENFQQSKLYQQDFKLFEANGTTGKAASHGQRPSLSGDYSNPMFASSSPVSLDEYKVIS